MSLLLDTHIAFWMMFEPDMLTSGEQAMLEAERASTAVSVVSLWELRIKWNRHFTSGARKGPADPAALLDALNAARISVIALAAPVSIAELNAPLDHSDPFDELLLTQAQEGGYRLLTRDTKLAHHPLAVTA